VRVQDTFVGVPAEPLRRFCSSVMTLHDVCCVRVGNYLESVRFMEEVLWSVRAFHSLCNFCAEAGIATGYSLSSSPGRVKIFFSCPRRPDRLWGSTQRPIQWVPRALFPGGRAAVA
jgi:hypothetical protein